MEIQELNYLPAASLPLLLTRTKADSVTLFEELAIKEGGKKRVLQS